MNTICATSISCSALAICKTNQQVVIHSTYNSSINLLVAKKHLLHIGVEGKGIAPFGICITANSMVFLQQFLSKDRNPTIQIFENEILLGKKIRLTFPSALLFNPSVAFYPAIDTTSSLQTLRGIMKIQAVPCGLPTIDLQKLTECLVSNHLDTLHSFIGKGAGLTPSGDDILCGYTAFCFATGKQALIVDWWNKNYTLLSKKTTTISYTYLEYAMKGEFSSLIINLLDGFFIHTNKLSLAGMALSKTGHTSGADILYGFILAANQYKTNQ